MILEICQNCPHLNIIYNLQQPNQSNKLNNMVELQEERRAFEKSSQGGSYVPHFPFRLFTELSTRG
jgi:hypothetical protein